jgi:tRNA nucleotidyltransferase/poly(A) polymerase
VRDALLGKETHDLDFTLQGNPIPWARDVADRLGGAFFILDKERNTARVIIREEDGHRHVLDFTALQGANIEEDLRARDFTITAMAVWVQEPQRVIDPLGGIPDLQAGVLRACSSHAVEDDPIRILRATRMSVQYDLRITGDVKSQIRRSLSHLRTESSERLRDEFFRILEGPRQASALKTLSSLGVLPYMLPGFPPLPPHNQRCLRYAERLWDLLGKEHDPEGARSRAMDLTILRLGRFREKIKEHLQINLVPERSMVGLMSLAVLFLPGDQTKAAFIESQTDLRRSAHHLRLSNQEAQRLTHMIRACRKVHIFGGRSGSLSSREVYRYFQTYSEAGVEGVFLALADFLAREGTGSPLEEGPQILDASRTLLEAWWEAHDQTISPPRLITGDDIMDTYDLDPGPHIGRILESIREEQAVGKITTKEEALAYIEARLSDDLSPCP